MDRFSRYAAAISLLILMLLLASGLSAHPAAPAGRSPDSHGPSPTTRNASAADDSAIDDIPANPATTKPAEVSITDQYPIAADALPAVPKEFAYVFSLPYGEGDRFPTDPAKFEEMLVKLKQCGFNTVHCIYRDWRHELFRKHGMKMMVDVLAWKEGALTDIRREAQRPYVEDFAKRVRDSDAIWGYNLWNERLDWCGDFKKLDLYVRMLRTWDPTHPVWVGTYRNMYSEHYPTPPGVVAYYDYHWQRGLAWHFADLKFYKALAEKRHSTIGMWEEVSDYPRVLYTLNTSIAYGTKTCIIFIGGPYDPKTGNCDTNHYLAKVGREMLPLYELIGQLGRPTDVFSTPTTRDAANKEKPEKDRHVVPAQTTPFPVDHWLQVTSGEVLCGFFKLPDGSDVVYVANHNAYAAQDVTMSTTRKCKVTRFDRRTRTWTPMGEKISFDLVPAGGEVLRFEREGS